MRGYCIWILILYSTVAVKCENYLLFARLCFATKPTTFDLEWTVLKEPLEGWYSEISSEIAARHSSEVLIGEQKTIPHANYRDMNLRVKITKANLEDGHFEGKYTGYINKTADFKCKVSKDVPGRVICDLKNTLTNYNEPLHVYRSYSDGKNVLVSVLCYPNGEVGWHTASATSKLTKDEKKSVLLHIKSLGFSTDRSLVVKTYG